VLENIDERDKDIFESLCKEDIEKAHKKAVDKGLLDVAEEIEKSVAHLSDKGLYKKLYNHDDYTSVARPVMFLGLGPRMQRVFSLLRHKNPGDMLDIACADGLFLNTLRYHGVITRGVGVEISYSRVHIAQETARQHKIQGVEFHHSMFEEFETDEMFDIIFMGEILEHCIDPKLFIAKACRYLKSNGLLITTTPIERPPLSEDELKHVKSGTLKKHVRFVDFEALNEATKGNNLKLVRSEEIMEGWKSLLAIFQKEEIDA